MKTRAKLRGVQYHAGQEHPNQLGPSALWLCEWLCQAMSLQRGMRLLDLACGSVRANECGTGTSFPRPAPQN